MSLRSPTENEIALTPTLSQRTGRGGFRSEEFLSYPRPLCGREGRVRVLCAPSTLFSKEYVYEDEIT